MKLHRFIGNFPLTESKFTVTDPEIVHQIKTVLKLSRDEEVIFGDGERNEAVARVVGFGKTGVNVQVLSWRKNTNEPVRIVTLYCSLLHRENFELACQKATETGAARIVPLTCARTVKLGMRADRLVKIIKEAAEQSGRGVVPAFTDPIDFRVAIDSAGTNERNIFFDKSGTPLTEISLGQKYVGVWIGPEGGWDADEVALARSRGFVIASLGKLTLRAETAAAVGVYLATQAQS